MIAWSGFTWRTKVNFMLFIILCAPQTMFASLQLLKFHVKIRVYFWHQLWICTKKRDSTLNCESDSHLEWEWNIYILSEEVHTADIKIFPTGNDIVTNICYFYFLYVHIGYFLCVSILQLHVPVLPEFHSHGILELIININISNLTLKSHFCKKGLVILVSY